MKTSKETAVHYGWGEGCDGWRLVQREELSVIHERMPAGTREVKHYHRAARQFFFVLAGKAVLWIDGTSHELGPHEGVEVAPDTAHYICNDFEESVEFLVISHPATRGDRVLVEGAEGE
ncbi:cupin domain-containing protein [Gorillibacterium sp. CAU 1737]|uniref:cupin domain-containing protein n=1 Tax=Gorillibacterium sp. CAU 1737 TaxID=3140362 RepID=UPI00325FF341